MKYQEDEIKAYCEEQGLNLIHIFREEVINGAKLNEQALEIDRGGLQEMLAHLSSVQIDYVVVLNTRLLWRSDIVKVLIQRDLNGSLIVAIVFFSYELAYEDREEARFQIADNFREFLDLLR